MGKIVELISSVDTKAWFIVGTILIVLTLLSLAKKALKLGIIIAVVIFAVTYLPGILSAGMDAAGVNITDETIAIEINNRTYSMERKSIDLITVCKDETAGDTTVAIETSGNEYEMRVSNVQGNLIKTLANSLGIKVVEVILK